MAAEWWASLIMDDRGGAHFIGVPVVLGKLWSDRGAAKVSPEPAMGLGWGLIPVGQGRSAGDRR